MKRFRFRLQRLERLRRDERRESEARMALAVADAADRRNRRELFEQAAAGAHLRWHEKAHGDSPEASRLRAAAELIETAWHAVTAARRAETKALEIVEARHHAYTEKARAHRVVQNLGERRRRRWLEEATREEQRLLDELHLLQLARSGRYREEES